MQSNVLHKAYTSVFSNLIKQLLLHWEPDYSYIDSHSKHLERFYSQIRLFFKLPDDTQQEIGDS